MKWFYNVRLITLWIASYLLILCVCVTMLAKVWLSYDAALEKTADGFDQYVLNSISGNVEDIVVGIQEIFFDISSNPTTKKILSVTEEEKYFSDLELIQYRKMINRYGKYKTDVDLFYLYFPNTDMVLSKTGLIKSKRFYDVYLSNIAENPDYEEWKQNLTGLNNTYYTHNVKGVSGGEALAYNMGIDDNNNGVLVSVVNKQRFLKGVQMVTWIAQSDIYIYDGKGELILSQVQSGERINYESFKDLKNVPKDKKLMFNTFSFDTSTIHIATIMSEEIVSQRFDGLKVKCLLILLICFVVGVAIMLLSLWINYKPAYELLGLFGKKKTYSEYHLASERIQKILAANNSMENAMSKQENELRRNQISHLLQGKYRKSDIEKLLKKAKIEFTHEKYVVFLLNYGDINLILKDFEGVDSEGKTKQLFFIVSNVLEELLNGDFSLVFMTEVDGDIACIVNYGREIDWVKEQVEMGIAFIEKNFDVKISYAVSDTHKSVENLTDAYYEARHVMEYKTISGNDGNITYHDISDEHVQRYCFSSEQEKKLITYIKMGDPEGAVHLIETIFERAIADKSFGMYYLRCVMFDVLACVLKAQDIVGFYGGTQNISDSISINERLSNTEELREYIVYLICELCDYINENEEVTRIVYKDKVLEYISQHYDDYNMTIQTIADKFHISGQYLSKKFKQETGEVLLEYINEYRVKEAKKMLEKTYESIAVISEKSGFTNTRTFNRAFKKYVGLSPTEYRNKFRQ